MAKKVVSNFLEVKSLIEKDVRAGMNAARDEVEIKLDSNGNTIFKSGEIAPNHYIEYAKLTKRLKAGEYEATATINAYDSETREYKGTSAAKLIIKIES